MCHAPLTAPATPSGGAPIEVEEEDEDDGSGWETASDDDQQGMLMRCIDAYMLSIHCYHHVGVVHCDMVVHANTRLRKK